MKNYIKQFYEEKTSVRFRTFVNYYRGYSKFRKHNKELAEIVLRNAEFKDKHKGERCFILGNAPSIKEQDLSLLENEVVMTVNQAARMEDFRKLKTNYHFFIDASFFRLDLSNSGDREIFETMKKIRTEDNNPICFFTWGGYEFARKTQLDEWLDMRYIVFPLEFYDGYNLPIDFTRLVPGFSTVVQMAIYTAIYMGFKEIYLLGCDCTGILSVINTKLGDTDHLLYGYEQTKATVTFNNKAIKNNPMEDYMLAFYNMFRDYRLLGELCKNNGCKLFNATEGGILDSIPRVSYEALF